MVITFPDCVHYAATPNGTTEPIGDGTDTAQVAYTNDDTPSQTCPLSLTPAHLIPFIQVGVRWDLNGSQFADALEHDQKTYDLTNFYLASDFRDGQEPVSHGASAHADFMSGWTKPTLDVLMSACLHQLVHVNCGYVDNNGSTW
jgi:hypothetical protein